MTDQVPNFTLPSQEAAIQRAEDRNPLLVRTFTVAKRVVPVLAAVALGVWGVFTLLKKAKERQLRDFQTQLQSFSSMLDLDAPPQSDQNVMESAKVAKQILETSSKRYKFRNADHPETEDDVASKVRLDLFKAGGSATDTASHQPTSTSTLDVVEVVPESEFEKAIAQAIATVETAEQSENTTALEALKTAREAAGLSEAESKAVFDAFLSRVVSAHIDRAAVNIDSDDRESLKNLHELALTMTAAKILGPDGSLKYTGAHAEQEQTREALYRRYAVFSLSSEERVRDGLQSLDDMQRLLSVTDARAETINTEIAKGMFQVAVSAAMADGSMKEEDREALDKLKDSFGELLEEESAESITSEVAVMRAMYALQQLLQEQGVTADDVKQMRSMCKDLGVDIEDMLSNADTLGNALGPEAKEFVENLRTLLSDIPEGDSDMVTTTGKVIDTSSEPATSEST